MLVVFLFLVVFQVCYKNIIKELIEDEKHKTRLLRQLVKQTKNTRPSGHLFVALQVVEGGFQLLADVVVFILLVIELLF